MEIFGWLGTVIVSLQFIPQLVKSIKSKDVKGLSLTSIIMILLGSSSWVLYSFSVNSKPILVSNIFIIFIVSLLLYIKLKHHDVKK